MAVLVRRGNDAARRTEPGYLPLSQAMNRLFQDSFLLPSVFDGFNGLSGAAGTNLWETGDGYVAQVAAPGMKPDGLQLTVEQNVLTIKGEASVPAPEQGKPIWQALGGQTEFQLQIPGEVDASGAEASYEAGILTVRLPKAQHARARTIQVTAK